MYMADIVNSLAVQGLREDEICYNVEQMIQSMAIYESNPGMYSVQYACLFLKIVFYIVIRSIVRSFDHSIILDLLFSRYSL